MNESLHVVIQAPPAPARENAFERILRASAHFMVLELCEHLMHPHGWERTVVRIGWGVLFGIVVISIYIDEQKRRRAGGAS